MQKQNKAKPSELTSNLWAPAQHGVFSNLIIKHCWEIGCPHLFFTSDFFSQMSETLAHLNYFGWKIFNLSLQTFYPVVSSIKGSVFYSSVQFSPHNTLNMEDTQIKCRNLAFLTNSGTLLHQECPCDALKHSQACRMHSTNTCLCCWLSPPWVALLKITCDSWSLFLW